MDPIPFRIATFNLESLDDRPGSEPGLAERIALLRPQLLRLRADVVCLQELNGQKEAEGGPRTLRALDRLLADTPYAAFHRVATLSPSGQGARDKHNLVILSRFPVESHTQIHHDLVGPPLYRPVHGDGGEVPVEWDRPFLHAALRLDRAVTLDVINVHLRAPRAALVAGAKSGPGRWRSVSGWAEGFFLAAIKRAGQAFEVRLFVDRLLDRDANALIVVCGDFNAEDHEIPVRTIRGDEEDLGNRRLIRRVLVPLEHSVPNSQRFSVIHQGRPQMVDHVLASRPLLAWYRGAEIHNEALRDEAVTTVAEPGAPESYHAPVVAAFEMPRGKAGEP